MIHHFHFQLVIDGTSFFSNHKMVVTPKTRNRLIVILVLAIPVAIYLISAIYKGFWGKPN